MKLLFINLILFVVMMGAYVYETTVNGMTIVSLHWLVWAFWWLYLTKEETKEESD